MDEGNRISSRHRVRGGIFSSRSKSIQIDCLQSIWSRVWVSSFFDKQQLPHLLFYDLLFLFVCHEDERDPRRVNNPRLLPFHLVSAIQDYLIWCEIRFISPKKDESHMPWPGDTHRHTQNWIIISASPWRWRSHTKNVCNGRRGEGGALSKSETTTSRK